jgi:predicted deacetylase
MPARYILRLDDIAPTMRWDNYERVRGVLEGCGVRPVLGVIPDNRDPFLLTFPGRPGGFWDEMRAARDRDWKLAMHGYQHVFVAESGGTLGLSDRSEFAGLPFDEQLDKIESGRRILSEQGIETDTFMAPRHSFDSKTEAALRDAGFTTITDGLALFPFERNGLLFVPQLFAAPGAIALPLGVLTLCLHLNTVEEQTLDAALHFVQRNRDRFICFDEARRFISRSPLNRAAGVAVRRTIDRTAGFRRRTRAAPTIA